MPVHIVDHPLVHDALVELRDKNTPPEHFRRAANRISVMLAAEALREVLGIAPPPFIRDDYDRQVAGVRGRLDEPVFAAAWQRGRAMTMEQAIEYAQTIETAPAQASAEYQPIELPVTATTRTSSPSAAKSPIVAA